jgi:RND superfamily putative drug exporter
VTDGTSDTDKIPVVAPHELERKPRIARTIRALALPIVIVWVLLAVGVNVFVPQLEKVAEEISVPLSPTDAPSVTGMKHIGEKFKEYDSDNLVLVTLVGDKPLGPDAHRFYDDLVKKIQADHEHVEHALNFWGQRFTSRATTTRRPTFRSTSKVIKAGPSATNPLPPSAKSSRTPSRRPASRPMSPARER